MINNNNNKYASYPDWRISTHANRRHRPSGGEFVACASRLPGQLSHLANDFQCIIDFSLFGPWGANAWAKVHQKDRWPGRLLDLPSCKISSPYVNPRPRYQLPKILRTEKQTNRKQTVNDISAACLPACGDNNNKTSDRKHTRFSTTARLFSPSNNRAADVRKSGRPAIGRYSWSSVWSADIWPSTVRTTGSTNGLPSSFLYASNTAAYNSNGISGLDKNSKSVGTGRKYDVQTDKNLHSNEYVAHSAIRLVAYTCCTVLQQEWGN